MPGLLIFIGLILVILNVYAIKRQDKSFDGALESATGNINDYDIKLGEIRREFSESIIELQREVMLMREIMETSVKHIENTEIIYEDTEKIYIDTEKIHKDTEKIHKDIEKIHKDIEKIHDENESDVVIDDFYGSDGNGNTDKVQDIVRLFSEGRSAEEISEILQLGKGEVLLIKDLYVR